MLSKLMGSRAMLSWAVCLMAVALLVHAGQVCLAGDPPHLVGDTPSISAPIDDHWQVTLWHAESTFRLVATTESLDHFPLVIDDFYVRPAWGMVAICGMAAVLMMLCRLNVETIISLLDVAP